MKSCETLCLFYADCNPAGGIAEDESPEVVEIRGEIHAGLEDSLPQCVGWSTLKYLFYPITYGVTYNAEGQRELPCNSPYRSTNEFWDIRRRLIDADRAANGEPPLDWDNDADVMGLYMAEKTQFHTSERIKKLTLQRSE